MPPAWDSQAWQPGDPTEKSKNVQRAYDVPIDVLMEIESTSGDQAVAVAQQFRQQLPELLKNILIRYQVVGANLALFEESLREIPQPDIRFHFFVLNAHLALSVQDDDLTMISELATDFCEDIGMRFGPTFSQMKIRKHVMDILYDRIAPRPDLAVFDR